MNKEMNGIERAIFAVSFVSLFFGGIISSTKLNESLPGMAFMIGGAVLLVSYGLWRLAISTYQVITLAKSGADAVASVTSVRRRYKYIAYTLSYCDSNGSYQSVLLENPMRLSIIKVGDTFNIKYSQSNSRVFIAVPSDYYKLGVYYAIFAMVIGFIINIVFL